MKKILWLLILSFLLTGCGYVGDLIPGRTTMPAFENTTSVPQQTASSQTEIVTEPSVQETEAPITLFILDEIDTDVHIATAGAHSRAIKAAEDMLDWGCYTGLDPDEIRSAAESWKQAQSAESLTEFAEKLQMVDDCYLALVGQDGLEHDDSGAWAWGRERVEPIEIIMDVFGLR